MMIAPAPCAPEQFRALAERDPERIAVTAPGASLSYGELLARSLRLARALGARGAGPEEPVLALFERSPDALVAQIGTLLAGATHVPVDPATPGARIAESARAVGARFAVCAAGDAERVRASAGLAVLALGDDAPARGPQPALRAEQRALILFTSGSSGTPKAVAIEHRGLMNIARWSQRAFALTPADRVAWSAQPGFAVSIWDVWPALALGARVVVVPPPLLLAPAELRDYVLAQGVTVAFFITQLAELLATVAWPARVPLRTFITGGERLRRLPAPAPFDVVVSYGITETSGVRIATRPYGPSERDDPAALPIGMPVDDTRAYVLDAALEPVADGATGELYVASDSLARGYVGRPGLTAERFLPDVFGRGGRMYRTGDVARRRADGALECLGRADNEIKVRGHRVNLDDLEAELRRAPGVADAAVVAGDAQQQTLTAFLTGAGVEPGAIRERLAATRPPHAVPGAFVVLDALPRTANFKVDRRALARAAAEHSSAPPDTALAAAFVPATERERRLAAIWAAELRAPAGLDDDFFALGGHSLLLSNVVMRASTELGASIDVAPLLQAPTLRTLLRLGRDARTRSELPKAVPLDLG